MAELDETWTVIVGRSLAFLCLHYAEMRDATLVEQADFLNRLGLPLDEAAALLGTSERSLKENQRQQTARKVAPKKSLKKSRTRARRPRSR